MIFLPIHAPSTIPYIIIAVIFYVVDIGLRIYKTHCCTATLTSLAGGMTKLEIQGIDSWNSSQHVWLRVVSGAKGLGAFKRTETHPFTISNASAFVSPLE